MPGVGEGRGLDEHVVLLGDFVRSVPHLVAHSECSTAQGVFNYLRREHWLLCVWDVALLDDLLLFDRLLVDVAAAKADLALGDGVDGLPVNDCFQLLDYASHHQAWNQHHSHD